MGFKVFKRVYGYLDLFSIGGVGIGIHDKRFKLLRSIR